MCTITKVNANFKSIVICLINEGIIRIQDTKTRSSGNVIKGFISTR